MGLFPFFAQWFSTKKGKLKSTLILACSWDTFWWLNESYNLPVTPWYTRMFNCYSHCLTRVNAARYPHDKFCHLGVQNSPNGPTKIHNSLGPITLKHEIYIAVTFIIPTHGWCKKIHGFTHMFPPVMAGLWQIVTTYVSALFFRLMITIIRWDWKRVAGCLYRCHTAPMSKAEKKQQTCSTITVMFWPWHMWWGCPSNQCFFFFA